MAKSLSNMTDQELLDVGFQTANAAGADPAAYHTTAGAVTALSTLRSGWKINVDDDQSAAAAAKSAKATKNTNRKPYEDALRAIRDGAKAGGTSDADMAAAGLPQGTPDKTTASVPVCVVDTSVRQRHTLAWSDAATANSKKRPDDARSCEIWRKIDGPPPTDVSQCSFVVDDTASPYEINYTGAEGGKIIHYMLRWHLRNGSYSGWGDTVSATVTA